MYVPVQTAEEMREAALQHLERATIVIKAAAVADYRVKQPSATKIKSRKDEGLTLDLAPNPDILKELAARKGRAFLVGFAAETNDVRANAAAKLRAKGMDLLVANDVSREGHRLRRRGQRGHAARPLGRRRWTAADEQASTWPTPSSTACSRCARPIAPPPPTAPLASPMSDPREALALALRGLADTLRHHRDLGLRDLALAGVPFPDPADALREQERARQGCQLCKLCKSRTNVAFGSGNARARLMVVGEGPGEEEDKQGLPFVGRAGQLLTKMLASVGFDRERDCYIANVVKCRPERNRNPEPDEVAACSPFLMAQIDTIRPARDPGPRQLRGADPARHQGRHHASCAGRRTSTGRACSCRPSIPPSCCAIPARSTGAWPGTISSWRGGSTTRGPATVRGSAWPDTRVPRTLV